MTYNDIIKSINYKIENSNFERFSQLHIIDELNNTYRDLANKTDIFETHDFLQLKSGQMEYTLPNRIHRPTRAVYRGDKIDFISQEEMDINVPGWSVMKTATENDTEATASTILGKDLQHLVYNNLSDRLVKPFPIISDASVDMSEYDNISYLGQLSDVSDLVQSYVYVNTSTGATYLADTPNGTISDLSLTEVVTIYGVYLPPRVTELNLGSDRIYVDEIHINALIYGTAGNLLFTSGRTEDAAKATNFMKLYGVDETEVAAIRKKDFSGGFRNTARNQNYRTPFKT